MKCNLIDDSAFPNNSSYSKETLFHVGIKNVNSGIIDLWDSNNNRLKLDKQRRPVQFRLIGFNCDEKINYTIVDSNKKIIEGPKTIVGSEILTKTNLEIGKEYEIIISEGISYEKKFKVQKNRYIIDLYFDS